MPAPLDVTSPQLHFGAGALSRLSEIVRRHLPEGSSLLLVADPGIPALTERTAAVLREAGCRVAVCEEVRSDPRAAEVDAAAEAARKTDAAAVIGLGGGSALDVAKLAAAVAPGASPAEAYALCRQPLPQTALPCILIPTTAGTGSEATRTAVFTTAAGVKAWAWGEELRARAAVLDPELSVGLPQGLTVATGVDALVHAMEAATTRRAHPWSDGAALQAIRLVREALPEAVAQPENLDARGRMLLASWFAGQAIDVAGTGIAHALGHALGALAHLHHGRAVGLCLRVGLAGNAAAAPAAHARVARAFGLQGGSDEDLAARLPEAFAAFLRRVGLELSLPGTGLSPERLAAATLAEENRPMLDANCRRYDEAELRNLGAALLAPA